MPEQGEAREVPVAVEAPDSPPTESVVDTQPVIVTFYTCGDGGCNNRLFGRLSPTNVYQQLALCLASPDPRVPSRKHAYPQIPLTAAGANHTYDVQEATQAINNLPADTQVEKFFFIGHGTGVPPGYFFSGYNRDSETNACMGRDGFRSDPEALFHLTTDHLVITLNWNPDLVERMNTAPESESNLRVFRERYGGELGGYLGIPGDQIEVEREYTDRQWIIRQGEWVYPVRSVEVEGEAGQPTGARNLCILGRHTPHLRDCYELVNAMKRRLVTGGHIGFLSCFTGNGDFIPELHRRITQESTPVPAVADVTIGGYEDYFESGYTRLTDLQIEEWHNRVVTTYGTDDAISEAQGRCGEDIIPRYQTNAPSTAQPASAQPDGVLSDDDLSDDLEGAEWE